MVFEIVIRIFVLLVSFVLLPCHGAPPYNFQNYPERNVFYTYEPQPRPFGSIGDWISNSEWFPIEINVPDVLAGIGNGIGNGITGIGNGISELSGAFMNTISEIPFINSWTSQETPRPLRYVVVLPPREPVASPYDFDPEIFPHYP